MGSSANIALRLRDRDLESIFRSECGMRVRTAGKKYLQVYVNNDGYPEGAGSDLLLKNMAYEQALAFILEGDRSTVEESYWALNHDHCPPIAVTSPQREYSYLYVLEEIAEGEPLKITYIDRSDDATDLKKYLG